jgi:site-specific DNA-methyltransferase (adenine-specific)
MLNQIIHGDCLEEMKHISDKSIDMILCDLPYSTTACKWDVIISFDKLWEQYKRIVKPNTAIVLTASQPFTSQLVMSNPEWFKYEWIWEKNTLSGFLNAYKQPLRNHESVLVFYEKQPTYNPQFEDYAQTTHDRGATIKKRTKNGSQNCYSGHREVDGTVEFERGRFPSTLQRFKTPKKQGFARLHPTQKPVALFEYLIKTYTNEGDLVLDNCCGSGTTAVAAINTNRNYICIEKEKEYFDIACDRINQPREYSELEIEIKELNKPEFKQLSLLDLI